jgi:predicted ATPase
MTQAAPGEGQSAAVAAYRLFDGLARRLAKSAPEERPTLAALALRAALHPSLAPFREDPLRTLGGEFVSLDVHAEALARRFRAEHPAGGPEALLPVGDCEWLAHLGRDCGPTSPRRPMVGRVGGALWLPADERAVPCVVRAAPVALPGVTGCVSVRPISPPVEASARVALAIAERMAPGNTAVLAYDVCVADLSESAAGWVAGESLELPLLLAFLSALTRAPVSTGLGATGALSDGTAGDTAVLPVGRVAEKAAAWREAHGRTARMQFLAPPVPTGRDPRGVLPVPTASEAANVAFSDASAPRTRRRRAAPAAIVHLPAPPTPLIGRDAERDTLVTLVRGGAARLLTLVGPGGVGKTHLALETARTSAPDFRDGALYVALDAADSDPAHAVAEALRRHHGATLRGDGIAAVAAHLRGRRVLLVLDGCETARDAVATDVTQLLAETDGVSVLATSRAPLLIRAERRFDVNPLREDDAVRLLSERAGIEAGGDEAAALCRRLDGLPLAVELAAAQLRHRTLAEVAASLGSALTGLSSPYADVPPRQRTMRAALEWSYRLLADDLRPAFAALSVFAGEFTAVDASAVLGRPAHEACAALEEQSLLACRPAPGGARFAMLGLVRAYAAERLEEEGDAIAVRDRYAEHFRGEAARLGACYGTPAEVDAFDALDARWPDLRAAWEWITVRQPEVAPEFAASLADYLRRRGHAAERHEWPATALAFVAVERTETPVPVRAALHRAVGLAAKDAGDLDGAEAEGRAALALAEAAGDGRARGAALNLLGTVMARAGRAAEAAELLTMARDAAAAAGDAHTEAAALNNLGFAALGAGDTAAARARYAEAARLGREAGDDHALAYALNGLGIVAHRAGEPGEAHRLFREYLTVVRRQRDAPAVAVALFNVATGHEEAGGDPAEALPALTAAEEALRRMGHRYHGAAADAVRTFAAPVGDTVVERARRAAARKPLDDLLYRVSPPPER